MFRQGETHIYVTKIKEVRIVGRNKNRQLAPQSKYYTETTKLDVLQKLIDEYQLLSLTVNIK